MKHPIDEPYITAREKALSELQTRKEQILELKTLSGWSYIESYFEYIVQL